MLEEIVNIRIDDRLIHGQIAAAWVGHLKADRIMVVDEFAVKDKLQKMALKMACPSGIKLSILSAPKAVANINNGNYEGERVFVIIKSVKTAKDLIDSGLQVNSINVGNMSASKDTKPIKKAVNITNEEKDIFLELAEEGVEFTAQLVPTESPEDLIQLIRKLK